eukprot:1161125-Pelagomonas_calceolata.AAC.15
MSKIAPRKTTGADQLGCSSAIKLQAQKLQFWSAQVLMCAVATMVALSTVVALLALQNCTNLQQRGKTFFGASMTAVGRECRKLQHDFAAKLRGGALSCKIVTLAQYSHAPYVQTNSLLSFIKCSRHYT